MNIRGFREFLRDESGSYTVWSLVWLALYLALGGFAVDMTDVFRVRTQLQATADSAALAGAAQLPDTAAAVSAALFFAQDNMPITIDDEPFNGNVAKPSEIYTGHWDADAEVFFDNGTPLNAVYVMTRRGDANLNPLGTNLLRIIGKDRFNILTAAIAIKFVPSCLKKNGLVANNKIDISSNNGFAGICIHAQNVIQDQGHDYAVDLGNNNTFDASVQVSMTDLDDLNGRPNVCTNNPGLCEPGVLKEGFVDPKEVGNLEAIFAGIVNPESKYMPSYMWREEVVNGETVLLPPTPYEPAEGDPPLNENYPGPYEPYKIYDIQCSNKNKQLQLPSDVVLSHVVIKANCQIHSSSNGTITASVVASTSTGNGQKPLDQESISLANGWNIGVEEFCENGTPDVRFYSAASAKIVAQTDIYGLHAVVAGTFKLTANADVYGISVQAGEDIIATSNGEFGFCGAEFEDIAWEWHYRLVR